MGPIPVSYWFLEKGGASGTRCDWWRQQSFLGPSWRALLFCQFGRSRGQGGVSPEVVSGRGGVRDDIIVRDFVYLLGGGALVDRDWSNWLTVVMVTGSWLLIGWGGQVEVTAGEFH